MCAFNVDYIFIWLSVVVCVFFFCFLALLYRRQYGIVYFNLIMSIIALFVCFGTFSSFKFDKQITNEHVVSMSMQGVANKCTH